MTDKNKNLQSQYMTSQVFTFINRNRGKKLIQIVIPLYYFKGYLVSVSSLTE